MVQVLTLMVLISYIYIKKYATSHAVKSKVRISGGLL
jgi:hypothetical protein